jgi:hypothetical protein
MAVRCYAQRIPALRLEDRELQLEKGQKACVRLQMAKQLRIFYFFALRITHFALLAAAGPVGHAERVSQRPQPFME